MSKKNSPAIKKVLAQLEKRFGEPVVQRMGEIDTTAKTFSSGRLDLDEKLGGGWGVGKIIELVAESGCGKTGLALEAVASCQKAGGLVAYIDTEHALNKGYCEQIGVNIDDLLWSQPTYGEQAFEAIRGLISTGEVALIVVDSVTNMVPQAELEGEVGEAKMALLARMMSKGLKSITGTASDSGTTVMFVNQFRATISMYGPSKLPTGGNALKFYASQRVELKNKGKIKERDEVIGFKQHLDIVKNKIGTPFRTADYNMIYGKGVDETISFMEAIIESGIVYKQGATYYYGDTKLCVGMPKLKALLEDNPDMVEQMKKDIKERKNS